ncbi:MAG: glycosyl hydrolase [Phocaeicola sp.]
MMKNRNVIPILCLALCGFNPSLEAQQLSDGRYAMPEQLAPLPQGLLKGYPQSISSSALKAQFKNPPKGYGNVPFYWWNGDKLTKEKLKHELDILKKSPLDGFAVSYVHTHPQADQQSEYKGTGLYGATEPGRPGIFTQEWTDIWKWFSAECAKEGIGVGLDDYTFAWTGNGYYPDEIRDLERMQRYQGRLITTQSELKGGEIYHQPASETRVSCMAWKKGSDAAPVQVSSSWTAPQGEWTIYDVTTAPNYMLEPTHGKELVSRYFQRIEDQLTPEERKGANYYFQDELHIPLDFSTWSEDLPFQFEKIKGYDVLPYLGALSGDIGQMTEKVRLDYFDVVMTLAEDRYFKPVFDWHWERGLLYGGDNLSRGKNPVEYVDYFRANRWFTAPGNDAPARGSSLLQTKVSSSISHLYERPRTWLEAFHSMGWGSSGEWLTSQLDHHIIAGGNLLCLHGLYYSTRGGWWEWAPPDFHYRMPYWEHMKVWLQYAERMSYLLSQGVHVCDIALIYPTEAMQAVAGKSGEMAFELGKELIYAGLDFDFMDYQSVARAEVKGEELVVSKEHYKVLILADLPALHHSTLEKALLFYRSGGVVVATGELPYASTLEGRSTQVDEMVRELFGVTAAQLKAGAKPIHQTNSKGGRTLYALQEEIPALLRTAISPDFVGKGEAKVQHRRIDNTDLYMVMNVAPGEELFFRATGKVELWDAVSGRITELPVLEQNQQGTRLRFDNSFDRSYLIAFTQGEKPIFAQEAVAEKKANASQEIFVTGEWEVEQVHTMNNRFGDFRLPVREEMIGAEARTFLEPANPTELPKNWFAKTFDDTNWKRSIYGYAPQAKVAFTTDGFDAFASQARANQLSWEMYNFSWQYGVWENPGNQGYHGLKGRIDDRFFIMGDSGHYAFTTFLYVPETTTYNRVVEGVEPKSVYLDGKPVAGSLLLKKGWHEMLVLYKDIEKKDFSFTFQIYDNRSRSAVLFVPQGSEIPLPYDRYSEHLSMRWAQINNRALFSPYGKEVKAYPFRFVAAPGLKAMEISAHASSLSIWVEGKPLPKSAIQLKSKEVVGANIFRVILPEAELRASSIAILATAMPGYAGTAIFPYPIRLECGKGYMEVCNWGELGEMRHYSGGLWYRKKIELPADVVGKSVTIDLGSVVATCEIHVNGQKCGVLLNSPFTMDLSSYVKPGNNEIEILVYSTLSNHYQTIPTPHHYRGDAAAGMEGPVTIRVQSTQSF